MRPANKIIDFQEHLYNKDIDSRIKSSRDDTLKIIQADIKVVDSKVDNNFEVLCSKIDKLDESVRADIKVLDSKVDGNFEVLDAKVDNNFEVLNTKIDKNFEVLNTKIDDAISMKKWVVGILITILLAIVIQIAPSVVAFFY